VVRADRGEVEHGEPVRRLASGDPAERLAVLVEGQERDDRQARDALDGLDRGHELGEVVERLDHEQVCAAPFEDPRLLGEQLGEIGPAQLGVADRPDRAGDEHVLAGHLARFSRQPHGSRVDALEIVLEEVRGELRPVSAERVRLDQLGPGADVADVDSHDALGRAEICLLGTAQPRHGARDQRTHPAVGHDRGPAAQALDELVRGLGFGHFALLPARSTHPPGLASPAGFGTLPSRSRLPRRHRAGSLSLSRCGTGAPASVGECSGSKE